MVEQLKQIIIDYQQDLIKPGISRDLEIEHITGKATICIGVRRSGKSTYMSQLMQKLLSNGVNKENIIHLNFSDDRLDNLQHESLGVISEAYYSMFPEKKNKEQVFFFFDEIQVVPNWENFVDRIMRTENCEVYITGSSAKMLSKEIATAMRGRSLSWEMFPFSFNEYLRYRGAKMGDNISTKKRLELQKYFSEYFVSGSFPEVLSVEKNIRIKIHQEYYNAILNRDIIERHNIKNPKALMDLSHWLINNISSRYTINSLFGYIKSLGHKITKTSISEFIDWFEDAFFLFSIHIFDASIKRVNANYKKIYCIDHSLSSSVASGVLINSGQALENLIFVNLRRCIDKISYYRTKNDREVDFIFIDETREHILIQVCESIDDPATRKREIDALAEAMTELNVKYGTIVTLHNDERIDVSSGTIRVIPAWRFTLMCQNDGSFVTKLKMLENITIDILTHLKEGDTL